jgi:hypothetical protein
MSRGWARLLFFASLLPLGTSFGCDALTVNAFSGAVISMTISAQRPDLTQPPLPAGQHLEIWARNANNDIILIQAYYDESNHCLDTNGPCAWPGIMFVPAVDPNDPCLIDNNGNLLTTAAAYPGPVTINGVTQTPDQQAKQVIDRINQLNNHEGRTLFAVVPFDGNAPQPPFDTPQDRLTACTNYRNLNPRTYIPNPYQITAPVHGQYFGSLTFISVNPPTDYDGIRIDTPMNLKGIQELIFTIEDNKTFNPKAGWLKHGPIYLDSVMVPGGRDIPHFTLVGNGNGASGDVSVYTNLDEAPAQF